MVKIAEGVEMLEVTANILGKENTVYPAVIEGPGRCLLVDTGYPGQFPRLKAAMEEAGVSLDRLTQVVITHHDIDHIGGLSDLRNALQGQVEILAHPAEKPYIQGEKQAVKVARLEARLDSLSPEMKMLYETLKAGFEKCKAPVDKVLSEGTALPYGGGITVIDTPGHTPGHICLYLEQHKILIAGDALSVEDGKLVSSPPFINFDQEAYRKSLKKLAQYDIETVLCYHGGLFKDQANHCIKALAC